MSAAPRPVSIITGTEQSIGAALAAALQRCAYAVVATSLSIPADDESDLLTVQGDITGAETSRRVVEKALKQFGRIDSLINNAGVYNGKPLTKYTPGDFAGHIVNLTPASSTTPTARGPQRTPPRSMQLLTRSGPRATRPIPVTNAKGSTMPFVKVGAENTADIEIHYNDHGTGKPIVLIHGYPLDGNSWERQERMLLENGYRCITYDRRGFGQSSQPTCGYDYDTFAADLKALLDHLALDQDVVLAGFSMGTGEVVRYLGIYGSAGVSKAMLLGVIPPFLLQTDDNPKGVPQDVFDGIKQTVLADRYAWFDNFLANFYNTDVLAPERIGEAALRASFQVAAGASPYASYACVDTWLTDFRRDLPKIDVPTLVVHGTADRILPFEATAARLRDERLIADLTVVEIADGPHNIGWTYPEETNAAMLEFLSGEPKADTALAATAPSSTTSA
jgi:non-heme chloroperoxidase